jgi:bifunctional non-homologous end joining protein LigD
MEGRPVRAREPKASPDHAPTELERYRRKRRFERTPEPPATRRASRTGHAFVVQKHLASHLHYDFRLEIDGVLKSWAVPKGPSLDPAVKRFAVAVEDHPLAYGDFEGVIPEGEYGAGTVMVWDRGTYELEDGTEALAALQQGQLKFNLKGHKLKGGWVLVRMRGNSWLLIKHRDGFASTKDIASEAPKSVASGRLLRQIAADAGGNVEKAATGDPDTRRQRANAAHPSRRPGAGRRATAGRPARGLR